MAAQQTIENMGQSRSVAELDALYHQLRVNFSKSLRLRLHRALSWLKRADSLDADHDLQFICYWVSFNALYGRQISFEHEDRPAELQSGDRNGFKYFLNLLCKEDSDNQIYTLLWQQFSGSIRIFLSNRYTYQAFWNYHCGLLSDAQALHLWEENQRLVQSALAKQNSSLLMALLFDRLYTVRNQLIHGASTYNSRVNREQVIDGCHILSMLLPVLILICLKNFQKFDLGEPLYPVIEE